VRPPLDRQLGTALETIPATLLRSPDGDFVAELRHQMAQFRMTDEYLHALADVEIVEQPVPGPTAAPEVRLLVCRPRGRSRARVPALYFVHGGGLVAGDRRSGLGALAAWISALGVMGVSVEYRLAPEHPYPASVEDCYAGLAWLSAHADELGVDRARIIVAGRAAGAGLAAAIALMARDRGGPAIAGQMLNYPMLDDRNTTPSSYERVDERIWPREANQAGWSALLGGQCGTPDVSAYAAPARAADLSGLPPAFIDVGSAEIFRDEAMDYAGRIWQAGGAAELHVWSGGFHNFDGFVPDAEVSRSARRTRLEWLRRVLAVAEPSSSTS
jgi:acetyl esterase/lipase